MPIPFVREIEFEYGRVDEVSPLIRRVIANNPGPFTYTGTGVYIVGRGEVAVIDPGPDLAEHFDALKAALAGERVTHVLVTHGHSDHAPLARPLAEWAGCKTYAKHRGIQTSADEGAEGGAAFVPDVELSDGDIISGPGWTLETIETPGHTASHICFALKEESACFTGDHIMGWSTTVVSPPDGDMSAYMESLEKVRVREFSTLWPTHGEAIRGTKFVNTFIAEYAAHRRAREAAILDQLRRGQTNIPEMVSVMYVDVDKRLHPAAAMSVLGHMIDLVRRGVVRTPDGAPTTRSQFELA